MKKLLGIFVVGLLAVPAMAFYPEGEEITFPQTPFYEEVTVTCGAVETVPGAKGPVQKCKSEDEMTQLLVSAYQERLYKDELDRIEKDKTLAAHPIKVDISRNCPGGTDEEFARMVKYKTKADAAEHPGFVIEKIEKYVEGKGYIGLMRWYDPAEMEGGDDDFVLFDVRRFPKDAPTDFKLMCDMEFPDSPDTRSK